MYYDTIEFYLWWIRVQWNSDLSSHFFLFNFSSSCNRISSSRISGFERFTNYCIVRTRALRGWIARFYYNSSRTKKYTTVRSFSKRRWGASRLRGKSEHHWARTRGEYGRPMVGIHVHNDAARKFISNVAGEQRIKASHDRRNIFAHTFFPSRLYNPKRAERKKKGKKKKQRKNEEEEKRHVHRHHPLLLAAAIWGRREGEKKDHPRERDSK